MKDIKLPILNQQAEKVGDQPVSADLFGAEESPVLVSQAVKIFLTRQRKALAKTKTRGEITGTTAKVWKQKGTGRARHGDRQAPIFVGGGKAHGPTGRQNYADKLNRKMSQKAVISVLSQKLHDKQAYLLEEMKMSKTKEAGSFVNALKVKQLVKAKVSLLHGPKEEIRKYFHNLADVQLLNAASLNVYDLLTSQTILITQKGLAEIVKKQTKND